MPPKKQPKPRAPRCAYVENGQRCQRLGGGNPPLCEPHKLVLEAEATRRERPGERFVNLLGRVFRGQKISDEHIYGGIEDFVVMFPGFAQNTEARVREHVRHFDPRAQRRAPPPPPRKPAGPDPRVTLGFAPGQRVTVDEVKARQRELARKHHPDRGGSLARMQEINAAVDQLLASM